MTPPPRKASALLAGSLLTSMLLAPALAAADATGAPFEDRLVDPAGAGFSPPKPALTITPTYPDKALGRALEGKAVVCFDVDKRGRAVKANVIEATHRLFRKPSLKAVRKSTFDPAQLNGAPVTAAMCRTYFFRLDPVNGARPVTSP